MTIANVKKDIYNHMGKTVRIRYNLGRNKYESFDATIKEMYDCIFLVRLENRINPEIKSFTYSDVLTKIIKIDYS